MILHRKGVKKKKNNLLSNTLEGLIAKRWVYIQSKYCVFKENVYRLKTIKCAL